MGIDVWTYYSTYRGIEIQEFTRSSTGITDYTAYTDTWVMSTSLSAVESKIDEFLGPVDGNGAAALGGIGLLILLYLFLTEMS